MEHTVTEQRVAQLRSWIDNEFGGRIIDLCRHYGLKPSRASYISQLLSGHRQFGERAARQLEQDCGRPPGWLDQGAKAVALPAPPPAPIRYDLARAMQLPEIDRRLIEEYIEFVLSRRERLRLSGGRDEQSDTLSFVAVASVPQAQRERAVRAARSAREGASLKLPKHEKTKRGRKSG